MGGRDLHRFVSDVGEEGGIVIYKPKANWIQKTYNGILGVGKWFLSFIPKV